MQYYLADGNQQRGPFPLEQLLVQGLRPDTLVWREGMTDWQRADSVPEVRALLGEVAGPPPVPPPQGPVPSYPTAYQTPGFDPGAVNSTKIAAGICAILLGSFGVHKFVLGMVTPGLIMLLVTCLTCGLGGFVMGIIGIIEGIIYLTKSDREFYDLYMVQKKGWF